MGTENRNLNLSKEGDMTPAELCQDLFRTINKLTDEDACQLLIDMEGKPLDQLLTAAKRKLEESDKVEG